MIKSLVGTYVRQSDHPPKLQQQLLPVVALLLSEWVVHAKLKSNPIPKEMLNYITVETLNYKIHIADVYH